MCQPLSLSRPLSSSLVLSRPLSSSFSFLPPIFLTFLERAETRFVFGASAAQSTAVAALDAFIGTEYQADHYLVQMRDYMPAAHRDLLAQIRSQR